MPWNLEAAAWSVMSHVLLYSINTFHTKKIQPYKGHIDCDYFLYHLLCSLFFICMCVNLCLCNFIFVYRLLYWNENIAALWTNIYLYTLLIFSEHFSPFTVVLYFPWFWYHELDIPFYISNDPNMYCGLVDRWTLKFM